eukprot:3097443-Amphidinium_carterae.1
MKPTWNNTTQTPSEFIKTFQNWRDEIDNYEQSVAELPSQMKMTLLIQNIQGDIKSQEKERRKERITQREKAKTTNNNPGRVTENLKEESTENLTMARVKEKEKVVTTATNNRKAATTEKERTKATEENQRGHHYRPTAQTTGKERKEEKEKEANAQTSCATTVENRDIRATNAGGTDKFTISTKHNRFGQYRMTTQHNHYNKFHSRQRLRRS